jgi:hypothetical protein
LSFVAAVDDDGLYDDDVVGRYGDPVSSGILYKKFVLLIQFLTIQ